MSFLPPVVLEIRAQAAQFYAETTKVTNAVRAMADQSGVAASGMSDKVSADAATMGERVAASAEAMAAKASAEAEGMATRIVAEAEQMDSGTTAAVEAMVNRVVAGFTVMTTETTAALEKQTAAVNAAMDTQVGDVVAAEQKTTAAVETATTAIVDALAEQGVANEEAAVKTTAAGIRMQEAFVKTAASAVGATGTMSSALAGAVVAQSTAMKGAEASITGIASGITKVAAVTGLVIAGVGLDMAAHFQKSTTLLVTAGGESEAALAGIRSEILNISADTGTSAAQLSSGMYVMEKAGYRGAEGLAALRASAEGAKAENVDLGTMTQATTDILLDYGYKMGTAKDATDSSVKVVNMLVAASGAAKVTMQDFAASMAAVVPIASSAKISFQEVGGAIATMTQHGQTAQQSSQNLANLIQSLIRPNNLAASAMQQFGIDTVKLAANLGPAGLSGTLKTVQDAVLSHMGPAGLIVQDTMKKSASATAALHDQIAQMPPELAKMSQGLIDGTTNQTDYRKAALGAGGSAGALAVQFLSLYKSSQGVNDALKAGQPAMMTYQAAMTKVLGNVTAARAATMLLMNNSQDLTRSIALVSAAADKGGNHISTWAETQSQLSTQLDMAKQRSEALAIQIGTKLIPAANGALSGFQDLFDGFEKGNPVLLGLAGIIGGVVVGTLANYTVNMIKAGVATVSNMINMGASAITMSGEFISGFFASELAVGQFSTKAEIAGAKVKASMKNMTGGMGAVGIAGAAVAVGMGVLAAGTEHATTDMQSMTKALVDMSSGSKAGTAEMDSQFSKWDTIFGGATSSAHGLDDAITYLGQQSGFANGVNNAVDGLAAAMGQAKSQTGQTLDKFKDVGTQLGQMVNGGSIDSAAKAFDTLAEKFNKNHISTQQALDDMPAYKQALIDQAAAVGQTLSPQQLLEFAMGKVPDVMLNAMSATQKYTDATGQVKPITPDLAKSLDDAGVSADGLVTKVDKILPAMEQAGLATVSTRDATSAFNTAIRDANGAVDALVKNGTDVSNALNQNASDFNLTTDAGSQLNAKYEAVLKSGEDLAKQAAGDGATAQEDAQKALQGTYDNLVNTGHQMGITGTHADDLARSVMGIPPGVDIATWMSQTARDEADKLKSSVDNIPPEKDVAINIVQTFSTRGAPYPAANSPQAVAEAGGNFADTLPGRWMGGIVGLAGGGQVPGTPPSNPRMDNILAMVNGKPLGLRSGEFVVNEGQTKANMPWLKAVNSGLNMSDMLRPRTPQLAYASSPSLQQASTHVNNDNSRTISNSVVINSTADAKALAAEFSRITANMS